MGISMSKPWRVNVFGVRHLSPAGAWHLRRYLDQIKPDVVLIEGLSDASELIPQVTRKGTKPPIALLAYTESLPIRTLIYPLARYSPEFQAMCWADEHDAAVHREPGNERNDPRTSRPRRQGRAAGPHNPARSTSAFLDEEHDLHRRPSTGRST